MLITVNQNDRRILKISGQFTGKDIQSLHNQIKHLYVDNRQLVIFDLHEVELIDSLGINMLLFTHRALKQKHTNIALVGLNQQLLSLFRTLKIDSIFKCYHNVTQLYRKEKRLSPL